MTANPVLHQNLRQTQILMYHGISASGGHGTLSCDAFRKQMETLRKHFTFIHPHDLLAPAPTGQRQALLTFDDGYHNNYQYAAPLLQELHLPAVFFVSHRHCFPGRYLWFSYLKALRGCYSAPDLHWRGASISLRGNAGKANLNRIQNQLLDLLPHPSEMYRVIEEELPPLETFTPPEQIKEFFSGMFPEELKRLAADPLFSLGVHTSDHPFLPKCSPQEARKQILENLQFLEACAGERPLAIAYPAGQYTQPVLDLCRELGLRLGFSITPNHNRESYLELPRIGIYSPSLIKTMIKITLAGVLRRMHYRIG